MDENVLETRGRALENAFFKEMDDILLSRMREAERSAGRRQALAAASGIGDAAVLAELDARGISAGTVAALALVPLVLVAWADGAIEAAEDAALRRAAAEAGLAAHPHAAALLQAWLAARPGPEVAAAWQAYARGLAAGMAPGARAALAAATIGRARQVAEAAGGFLGLGARVSAAEARVLAELDAAFADHPSEPR